MARLTWSDLNHRILIVRIILAYSSCREHLEWDHPSYDGLNVLKTPDAIRYLWKVNNTTTQQVWAVTF